VANIDLKAPIAPNGPFPSVYDTYFSGGFRSVADLTELNAIVTLRRVEGMWVIVRSSGAIYQLLPSPWNSTITDWTLVPVAPALPAYAVASTGNCRLVCFNGVLRWQQYESAVATYSGSDTATPTWNDFESRPYRIIASQPRITDGLGFVNVQIVSPSSTGATFELSGVITGEVDIEVTEVLS
jgi:hypothetical protein